MRIDDSKKDCEGLTAEFNYYFCIISTHLVQRI